MRIERRRALRVEVLGRLQGEIVSLAAPLMVREVSLGGLSFGSTFAFPSGVTHEFRLTLGDGSEVLRRGRVVRSQEKIAENGSRQFITGVQFVDDEPMEDDSPVGDLINKIK